MKTFVSCLLQAGAWFPPGTPVSSTRKLISSSFHHLDMTLAVAEALNPNKLNQTHFMNSGGIQQGDVQQAQPLTVETSSDGHYKINIQGQPWMRSAATFLQANHHLWSTTTGDLKLAAAPSEDTGSDSLGRLVSECIVMYSCLFKRWPVLGTSTNKTLI